jgi:hypothetical protein
MIVFLPLGGIIARACSFICGGEHFSIFDIKQVPCIVNSSCPMYLDSSMDALEAKQLVTSTAVFCKKEDKC